MAVERKLINESKRRLLMTEFLHREAARAGFGGCEIQRTPLGLRIRLVAERPGFVIGRRGSTIQRITRDLKERFDLENPQIEVEEAEDPNLNPQIMAQKLAEALERGWHFRRAGHSTVRRIVDSGAKGCQIILTGKLTGSRGRMEKFTAGHIKHCGEPAEQFMGHGYAVAKKKLGTIGVKVNIMAADARLPDEIIVASPGEVSERAKEISEEAIEEQEQVQEALEEIEAGVEEQQVEEDTGAEIVGAGEAPDDVSTTGDAIAETEEQHAEAEEVAEAADTEAKAATDEHVETDAEPSPVPEAATSNPPLTDIQGVGKAKAEALEEAGYDFGGVLEAEIDELAEVPGIGKKLATKIKNAAREIEEREA